MLSDLLYNLYIQKTRCEFQDIEILYEPQASTSKIMARLTIQIDKNLPLFPWTCIKPPSYILDTKSDVFLFMLYFFQGSFREKLPSEFQIEIKGSGTVTLMYETSDKLTPPAHTRLKYKVLSKTINASFFSPCFYHQENARRV